MERGGPNNLGCYILRDYSIDPQYRSLAARFRSRLALPQLFDTPRPYLGSIDIWFMHRVEATRNAPNRAR